MSEITREWKYLERRPGSSYQQLSIKGRRIRGWTLYCEHVNPNDARTAEELAADWGIHPEAVQEAIAYCQVNPPELFEDHRKDEVLAEAIGMNEPAIRQSGRPRSAHRRASETRVVRLLPRRRQRRPCSHPTAAT